jgi:hypothetical protein
MIMEYMIKQGYNLTLIRKNYAFGVYPIEDKGAFVIIVKHVQSAEVCIIKCGKPDFQEDGAVYYSQAEYASIYENYWDWGDFVNLYYESYENCPNCCGTLDDYEGSIGGSLVGDLDAPMAHHDLRFIVPQK